MKNTSRALPACVILLLALAPVRLLAQCFEIMPPAETSFAFEINDLPLTEQIYFDFENNSGSVQYVDVSLSRVSGPDHPDWVISLCRGELFCLPILSFNQYSVSVEDSVETGVSEYYDILINTAEENFGTGVYALSIVPQDCPEQAYEAEITITLADEVSVDVRPRQLSLGQNWPNPFNPDTRIPFELRSAGAVSMDVYDLAGRLVASPLQQAFYPAGQHALRFEAGELASGIYLYTVRTPFAEQSRRMILAR